MRHLCTIGLLGFIGIALAADNAPTNAPRTRATIYTGPLRGIPASEGPPVLVPVDPSSAVGGFIGGAVPNYSAPRPPDRSADHTATVLLPMKRDTDTADRKLLDWQVAQATNGVASAMYALGIRYLRGQGVPTNQLAGSNWLSRAAARGHVPALQLLGTLTNRPAR